MIIDRYLFFSNELCLHQSISPPNPIERPYAHMPTPASLITHLFSFSQSETRRKGNKDRCGVTRTNLVELVSHSNQNPNTASVSEMSYVSSAKSSFCSPFSHFPAPAPPTMLHPSSPRRRLRHRVSPLRKRHGPAQHKPIPRSSSCSQCHAQQPPY